MAATTIGFRNRFSPPYKSTIPSLEHRKLGSCSYKHTLCDLHSRAHCSGHVRYSPGMIRLSILLRRKPHPSMQSYSVTLTLAQSHLPPLLPTLLVSIICKQSSFFIWCPNRMQWSFNNSSNADVRCETWRKLPYLTSCRPTDSALSLVASFERTIMFVLVQCYLNLGRLVSTRPPRSDRLTL